MNNCKCLLFEKTIIVGRLIVIIDNIAGTQREYLMFMLMSIHIDVTCEQC